MQFIVVSKDYAGLGFAVRLQDEGHDVLLATNPDPNDIADPDIRRRYQRVGDGMVQKVALHDLLENRSVWREAYWVWDLNHSVCENELLRSEGFRVLGGGQHAYTMEHDRQACLQILKQHGLEAPPSFHFDSAAEAIQFCQGRPGTSYVYKPDSGQNFETFLPEAEDPGEANRELQVHLWSLLENRATNDSFLLQERKDGVETNVEVWFLHGEPVFSFMTLECKKKYVLDLGELTGCAFDYDFIIPLDSRAVAASVGKLFCVYKQMSYTGFADANFVAAKDGVWFLEKCERFGYNAHPNLFWNLAKRGTGEIIASLLDGNFTPDFAEGFGTSVTMSTKESAPADKPILFPEKITKDLYMYDVYRRYDPSGDVLLVNGYGFTMPTAWETVMKKAAEVRFPYRHYRPDGDQTNYPSSPIRRYEALKAMGYI